jgi:hypothetical protein
VLREKNFPVDIEIGFIEQFKKQAIFTVFISHLALAIFVMRLQAVAQISAVLTLT